MARRRRTDRILRERRERKYRLRGGKARTTRFIPDADLEFAQMAKLFANHIAEHAERFGFTNEKVAELNSAVANYREALCRTMLHSSAGPKATMAKNESRQRAEKLVRNAAKFLRGTVEETLTNFDRLVLNMSARPKRAKRRACPQVAPMLTFKGSTDPQGNTLHGARHILEYGNDFDRASGAKPHGAVRLELFVELVPIGDPIPSHPAERSGGRLWYLGSFTTKRFEVAFPVLVDGDNQSTPMIVCYWGRWADASGGVGPFSQTCVTRMEGGPELYGRAGYGLPGAQHEQIRVTQVVGHLEARMVMMSVDAMPLLEGDVTSKTLPETRAPRETIEQQRPLDAA